MHTLQTVWHWITENSRMVLGITIVVASLIVVITAAYLRLSSPETTIVVESLQVSGDVARDLGITDTALAHDLADELQTLIQSGRDYGRENLTESPFGPIPEAPHIPVRTSITIGFKGINVEQLLTVWDYIRYDDRYTVTGDLVGKNELYFTGRYVSEHGANSFTQTIPKRTAADVEAATAVIADNLLSDISPETVMRSYAHSATECQDEECKRQFGKAMEATCSEWAKKKPGEAKVSLYTGIGSYLEGQDENVIRNMDTAIKLNPHLGVAYNVRGMALMRLGRLAEAEATFKKVPTGFTAMNLGSVELLQGKCTEAIKYYQQAERQDPKNALASKDLGDAFICADKTSDAKDAYESALQKKSTMVPAVFGLTLALAKMGKGDDALHYCESHPIDKGWPEEWCKGRVWLSRADGNGSDNATKATHLLREAERHLPKTKPPTFSADLVIDIGRAQLKMGNLSGAQDTLGVLVRYYSAHPNSKTLLAFPVAHAHLYLARIWQIRRYADRAGREIQLAQELYPNMDSQSVERLP
jgi:tetratricopeptide (TPR) repeat protein